jgi:ADP-ribose pyrophosphatase YjhB (NUDIX family)
MNKYSYEAFRYALVIVRNKEGKFLCIKEKLNKGWWIAGGKVSLNETFLEAAIR